MRVEDAGFDFKYWIDEPPIKLKVIHAYGVLAGLLALTVYCFALALRSEKQASWIDKLGNYAYGLAIMTVPLYGGLFVANWLGDFLEVKHWSWAVRIAPMVPLVLGAFWLLVSGVLALWLRRRLSEQDRKAKIEQLTQQEMAALNRAPEMFDSNHYDLAIIESWKALEARLRRALLEHRYTNPGEKPEATINAAFRASLLKPAARASVDELRRQWQVAIGTEPSTRESADKALKTTRDLLATIPIAEGKKAA
jgi:hypothetical protein